MNRPGPVPLVILSVFALVFAIEFRTILSMLGVDVSTSSYYAVMGVLLVAAFVLLLVFTDGSGGTEGDGGSGKVTDV